jgi:hypothetical protein
MILLTVRPNANTVRQQSCPKYYSIGPRLLWSFTSFPQFNKGFWFSYRKYLRITPVRPPTLMPRPIGPPQDLKPPDHETDGQNGPEIFPNYEADRAIRFLRESFVLMHDSEARAQQMLDDAFGDLLGFLPGNFAARMILSAIANCGRDDSINLVGIGQCESPRCHCLRCAGHDLALRLFNGDDYARSIPSSSPAPLASMRC